MMTREEHLVWCKDRAIREMDFYNDPSKAYVSMASDLRKHPETNSEALVHLCLVQLMGNPRPTRSSVIAFLEGFH